MDYYAKAEAAELRGDYQRARMWWFYAAASLRGNPHGLRTFYCQKEDEAAAIAAQQRQMP